MDFQVLDAQRQLAEYHDALAQSLGQSAADLVAAYKAFGGGRAGTKRRPAGRN